jgi:hypothetical protein
MKVKKKCEVRIQETEDRRQNQEKWKNGVLEHWSDGVLERGEDTRRLRDCGGRAHSESGGKLGHLTALMDIAKFDSYNPSRVLKKTLIAGCSRMLRYKAPPSTSSG